MNEPTRTTALFLTVVTLTLAGCDETETGVPGGGYAGTGLSLGIGGRSGLGSATNGGNSRGGNTSIGGTGRGGNTSIGGTGRGGSTSIGGTSTIGFGGAMTSGIAAKCSTLCNIVVNKACAGDAEMSLPECLAECDPGALGVENCLVEYDAWLTCYISHPESTWICDSESGSASPPFGACDDQTAAVSDCAWL